ncbi:MAG: M56 family metallopeptidase [Planctomycetota bacterium]
MLDVIFTLLLAWLGTYLIHSCVLLGSVWVGVRCLPMTEATQETLWKLALVGGIFTATGQRIMTHIELPRVAAVQTIAARPTPAASFDPNESMMPRETDHSAIVSIIEEHAAPLRSLLTPEATMVAEPSTTNLADTVTAPPVAPTPAASLSATPSRWQVARQRIAEVSPARWIRGCVIAAICTGGLFWIVTIPISRRRFRRVPCATPEWQRMLEEQTVAAGMFRRVRLTTSPDIAVPCAFGVFRPEICLPDDAGAVLSACELRAAVAHEIAHLRRHDPAWLSIYRAMRLVFFMQPLNRLAVRRLLELAEYQCDAWAANSTSDPLALARCLERVASRLVRGSSPALVASLAMSRSMLGRRVTRLLATGTTITPGRRSRWATSVASTALIAVTLHVPGVQAQVRTVDDSTDENSAAPTSPDMPMAMAAETPAPELDDELSALAHELQALRREWAALRREASDGRDERMNTLDRAMESFAHRYRLLDVLSAHLNDTPRTTSSAPTEN